MGVIGVGFCDKHDLQFDIIANDFGVYVKECPQCKQEILLGAKPK